jgi:FAD:protein FMN transferase
VGEEVVLKRLRPLLGTFVEVGAQAPDRSTGETALDVAFEVIDQVHQRLSFQSPHSELTRLNRSAGEPVALHRSSLRLLHLALRMMRASGGLFNITVGGALVQAGRLPDHGGPAALAWGRADDVCLGADHAQLRRPVRLTLDGVAKGYAVDLALQALRRHGLHTGWVNAGGDLRVMGDLVLPVHRRGADRRLEPLGGLRQAALASSWVQSPDVDPDPDFPACLVSSQGRRPAQGVLTVMARTAWRADALTKVAALTPAAQRSAVIARLGGSLLTPPSNHAAPLAPAEGLTA